MQPALDGAQGEGQGSGGELLGLALEVAENNQDAEGFGEAVDFLVEYRAWCVVAGVIVGGGARQGGLALAVTAAGAMAWARAAVRRATRCSQGPSESWTQRSRDLRRSTRKVA